MSELFSDVLQFIIVDTRCVAQTWPVYAFCISNAIFVMIRRTIVSCSAPRDSSGFLSTAVHRKVPRNGMTSGTSCPVTSYIGGMFLVHMFHFVNINPLVSTFFYICIHIYLLNFSCPLHKSQFQNSLSFSNVCDNVSVFERVQASPIFRVVSF